MNANFDLRRQLYGDNVLGAENIRMITLGRQVPKIWITVLYPTLTLVLTLIITLIITLTLILAITLILMLTLTLKVG